MDEFEDNGAPYSESLVLVIGVHCLAEVMVTVHMHVARTSQIDSRHGDAMTITPQHCAQFHVLVSL